MEFLDIPEEVIEGHLLPFLKWNDLLRFRRVCKTTKFITNGFLSVHPELAPEIEINEEDKSFGNFLEMGIPTTKIFLKNLSGDKFYSKDEKDIGRFLERYGGIIKSLRVHYLSVAAFGNELDFMEALVNLKKLYVGRFYYGMDPVQGDEEAVETLQRFLGHFMKDSRYNLEKLVVPQVLNKLAVLRIGQEADTWELVRTLVDGTGYRMLDQNVLSLEEVCLPFTAHTQSMDEQSENVRDAEYTMHSAMTFVLNHIKKREEKLKEKNLSAKANMKVVDFANFHDPKMDPIVNLYASVAFFELTSMCNQHGIKLMNVSPLWFVHHFHHHLNAMIAQLGAPIVSLVGLHPCILSLEMPNLEKVEIKATTGSSVGANWNVGRPEWPALKCLDITVNSKKSEHVSFEDVDSPSMVTTKTKTLFQFFFQDVVRPELTEVRLNFAKDDVPIPKAMNIVGACPNLKKLTLVNWPGTNKALAELFGGLPGLEEISLERCKNLGNVAFVGEDSRSPVFFKLPRLKKLSLKGLDHMPKVTDLLFTMVIRHLKLTHFIVTSDRPIKSVTSNGVRALLEGNFADTIEKFPFQDFSLNGVSTEDLKKLEKQFRSYNML